MTEQPEKASEPVEGVPPELAPSVDKEMFTDFERADQTPVETREQPPPGRRKDTGR